MRLYSGIMFVPYGEDECIFMMWEQGLFWNAFGPLRVNGVPSQGGEWITVDSPGNTLA